MTARRSTYVNRIREISLDTQALEIAREHFGEARVEPETLARKLGIAFRYASFPENFDGLLAHDRDKFYIVCNDRLHPRGSPRSRFTFAHELAHALIREHADALKDGTWPVHYSRTEFTSLEPKEREADIFAAGLLMPRDAFWSRINAPFDASQLAGLAHYFGASLTATAFRALRTGVLPGPAAVIRWDATGRQTARNVWSTDGDEQRLRNVVSTPPAGSITAWAIETLAAGIASDVRISSDWFLDPVLPGLPAIPLREEVISLGSYGWITLLSSAAPAS